MFFVRRTTILDNILVIFWTRKNECVFCPERAGQVLDKFRSMKNTPIGKSVLYLEKTVKFVVQNMSGCWTRFSFFECGPCPEKNRGQRFGQKKTCPKFVRDKKHTHYS